MTIVMQTMLYCGANWYLEISAGDCQVQFMVTAQHNTLTTANIVYLLVL